ncbi:hypothetical protein F2Q68_00005172 [Brassica cretica]|uniref:Uncharacterized protein n=1 Tax=Brassica cretica TaxID=69181 RepID=A0A8S9J4L9_BRACR|nr:hypothetical protein F2Q68_00005172 [Brassica cretica]
MPLSVDRATRVSIDRHLTMSIDAHQQRSGSKYKHQDPDTISGSIGKPQVLTRPQDPITTSGSNHDLKNLRVPSTVSDLNENLRVPLRPLGPRYDLTI